MRDIMSVRMLKGKASTVQAAVHTLTQLRSEFWLLFRARAKGIMFYDVPVSYVKEELRFRCELEPFNVRNANSIHLNCPSTSEIGFSSLSAFAPIWISY